MGLVRKHAIFERWTRRALSRVWGTSELSEARVERAWTYAHREVSARLLCACATERLLPAEDNGKILTVGGLRLSLRRTSVLGRPVWNLDGPRSAALEDPGLCLDKLAPLLALDPATERRVRSELLDAAFNMSLGLLARDLRAMSVARHFGDPRVCDPEHFCVSPHPWDPLASSGSSLSLAEHLGASAEQLARSQYVAVDVPKTMVARSGSFDLLSWGLFAEPPGGMVRLPVNKSYAKSLQHTLASQWGHSVKLADVPKAQRVASGIGLLHAGHVRVTPRLRSPVDLELATRGHKKQGLPAHHRIGVSRVLESIATKDPTLGSLRVLYDRGAAGLHDSPVLDVIAHDPPAAQLRQGEQAWLCSALEESWPGRYQTLAEACMEDYPGRPASKAEMLVRDWTHLLVIPVLRLAVEHGIALAPALDSTYVVVRGGHPVAFMVRGLGETRISPARFAARGHARVCPALPGHDDFGAFYAKLIDSLFVEHLSALFGWLEDVTGFSENRAWARTREELETAFGAWPLSLPDQDRRALFGPRWAALSRLGPRFGAAATYPTKNPLFGRRARKAA